MGWSLLSLPLGDLKLNLMSYDCSAPRACSVYHSYSARQVNLPWGVFEIRYRQPPMNIFTSENVIQASAYTYIGL
jgi:hypothetical protein